MKTQIEITILASILVTGQVLAGSDIDELAELMNGKFDTALSGVDVEADGRLVDQRIRVDAPRLGEYVFYQQINHHEDLEVYRQRILVLKVSASGRIEQRAYAFEEPEWYVDADPGVFSSMSTDSLNGFMPEGCEQVWTRTAEGFRGYVDPNSCQIISSRTGKPRQIESENLLTADSISLVERGYDPETGEQLFGSPQGESMLLGREP